MIGSEKQKLIKKRDIALISILLVLSCFLCMYFFVFASNKNSLIAIIKYDNNEIYNIDLNNVEEPYCIQVDHEYHSKILVEKGQICFLEADCPDKVCVNTGKLNMPGQVAVCLPAKLIIEIKGVNSLNDAIIG